MAHLRKDNGATCQIPTCICARAPVDAWLHRIYPQQKGACIDSFQVDVIHTQRWCDAKMDPQPHRIGANTLVTDNLIKNTLKKAHTSCGNFTAQDKPVVPYRTILCGEQEPLTGEELRYRGAGREQFEVGYPSSLVPAFSQSQDEMR